MFQGSSQRRPSRPCRQYRLELEQLEEKILLSSTLTVNTTNDTTAVNAAVSAMDSSGNISLRSAIQRANFEGGDTIIVPAGTYDITIPPSGVDGDDTGDFNVKANTTIQGAGAAGTIINGGKLDRVFEIDDGGVTVGISGVTIQNGEPGTNSDFGNNLGGGILNQGNLTLTNSVVTNNLVAPSGSSTSASGGGIMCFNSLANGSLTLINSTVSNNKALGSPGGGSDGGSANGGGIADLPSGPSCPLTLINSTISGNKAIGGDATGADNFGGTADGGGINTSFQGPLTMTNSTISGNIAQGGNGVGDGSVPVFGGDGEGGGLYDFSTQQSATGISNSTISLNQASGGGFAGAGSAGAAQGGGFWTGASGGEGGWDELTSTIVAQNTVSGPGTNTGPDLANNFISGGHNLIGDATGSTGFTANTNNDLVGVNALLGPLQDNGGPTQTMALTAGSPAINAGSNPLNLTTDQRGPGFNRVVNGTADIGAFEFVPSSGAQGLTGVATITGNEFTPLTNVRVATFTIPGGGVAPGSLHATINWGDGSASAGLITQSGSTYTVLGSHTYAEHAAYTITTTIGGSAGAPAVSTAVVGEELLPGQNTSGRFDQRLVAEIFRDLSGHGIDAFSLAVWTTVLDNTTALLDQAYLTAGLSADQALALAFTQATGGVTLFIEFEVGFQPPGGTPLQMLSANYRQLLDRPLDAAGANFYLPLFNEGITDPGIVSLIVGALTFEYVAKVV